MNMPDLNFCKKFNDNTHNIQISIGMLEFFSSLINAIEDASGNIPWEGLENLTLKEFSMIAGANNIRFYHDDPKLMQKFHDIIPKRVTNDIISTNN